MPWRHYQGLSVGIRQPRGVKERYSITADILSFQLCRRQYGFFAVRKYQPAHIVQIWYGMVIHQVLDKLHMHYKGLLDPQTEGQIPSDSDVEAYFVQVENSLRARGVRAISPNVRDAALKVLKVFNRIEGPALYPNVIDTECKLQSDQGDYILHGKVDVLRDISVGRKIPNYASVEIWDYKGTSFPDTNQIAGREKLNRYLFQMLVYAELYRERQGEYPLKGVLYFMNELYIDPEPTVRPPQAIYEIDFRNTHNIEQIQQAMSEFSHTVNEIEQCKLRDEWDYPQQPPDEETCDICDLRWNCRTVRYQMRYP